MVAAKFDDESYEFLLQILTERYYTTTNVEELAKINKLYKILKYKSESWLTAFMNMKEGEKNHGKFRE